MPRRARIVVPGELFHVTQRGNYRQKIFDNDRDKVCYLKYVEAYAREYALDIFSYCLMENHIHFIVRPQNVESLGNTFCRAHQKYSLYFHARNKVHGHLWQERFYSCLLSGQHIIEAIRYVERNPVRANIVQRPWDYSWSSARAHLGTPYKIITLSDIGQFIDVISWKDYLMCKEDPEVLKKIRIITTKGLILAPQEVVERFEITLGRSLVPQKAGRPRKLISACH